MTQVAATPANLRMGALEWTLLLFLSVLWGGSFFFGKVAVAEMAPFTIVLCRVAIGSAILALVVKLSGLPFPSSLSGWAPYLVMGLLNNVIPFSLIFWSQQYIEEGLASVLNAGTPLAGAIVAHFLTQDEKLHSNRLVGVLIGIAGVAVLIGPSSFTTDSARLAGAMAVLVATFSYGFAGVWGKRFRGTPALTSACCQLASSTLIMAPLVLAFDRPWTRPMPGATTWAAILALAVFSTALAYVIFFTILRRAGAANVMLVTLLVPFTASILGVLFLNEAIPSTELAGATLVALALLIIDGRRFAALRRLRSGQAAA
jgi:drug/metabolite transporter (DMT)-like permease